MCFWLEVGVLGVFSLLLSRKNVCLVVCFVLLFGILISFSAIEIGCSELLSCFNYIVLLSLLAFE